MALPDPLALIAPARTLRSLDEFHDAWLAALVAAWLCRLRPGATGAALAEVHAQRAESLADEAARAGGSPRLLKLAAERGLGPEERDALELLLAVALAPELRTALVAIGGAPVVNLEGLCAALAGEREQGLTTRRRLLDSSALAELTLRDRYGLRLASGVAHWLLGAEALDDTLTGSARLIDDPRGFDSLVLPGDLHAELRTLARAQAAPAPAPAFLVQVQGPPGAGRSLACEAFAHEAGRPLLRVDGSALAASPDGREALSAVFRDAALRGALPCLDPADAVLSPEAPLLTTLLAALDAHAGAVLVTTRGGATTDPAFAHRVSRSVALSPPGPLARRVLWERAIRGHADREPDLALDLLSADYALSGGAIASAARLALTRLRARPEGRRRLDHALLANAAAAVLRGADSPDDPERSGPTLADLVLPSDTLAQVHETLAAARQRSRVMSRWGFGERLSGGRGLVALFAGEPGTGKTLCAEVLANELNQPLHRVSVPEVMSKYVGETEKNLSRAFAQARASRAVLLFDEADALFTRRVKVERAADRFSNMEVNLLLQEIERFDGVVVLTTNLEREMDPAFERRVQYRVLFPFPELEERTLLWARLIPPACPLAPDVDLARLAGAFELAGGHLRNVVLRAACAAAEEDGPVAMAHFTRAAEAECRKAGKLFRMP